MFTPSAHIIIIDGKEGIGKKTFSFELALTLLYNAQKTALLLANDSPLRQTIKNRLAKLPEILTPAIINKEDFYNEANKYKAVIIPEMKGFEEFALTASTYITLLSKPSALNTQKINTLFELKKKIASSYNHSLNWIICENRYNKKFSDTPSPELQKKARAYGFRVAFPLNQRQAYHNNTTGISAQDKNLPMFKKDLTYEDICAKREIIKLAEFIFGS